MENKYNLLYSNCVLQKNFIKLIDVEVYVLKEEEYYTSTILQGLRFSCLRARLIEIYVEKFYSQGKLYEFNR